MDSSQRALETNGISFIVQISYSFLSFLTENQKFSKDQRVMNIDQIAMFYILIILNVLYINGFFWQALQTNGKFFFQISNSFSKFWRKTEFFPKE